MVIITGVETVLKFYQVTVLKMIILNTLIQKLLSEENNAKVAQGVARLLLENVAHIKRRARLNRAHLMSCKKIFTKSLYFIL